MKRSLVKRLSGAIAAAAVALAGAFASIPAAYAATTYTLDQVSGSAAVDSLTYRGQAVGGVAPNGQTVSGQQMPKYGFGTNNLLTMYVRVSVDDVSKLKAGDRISIPLSYPSATQSSVMYGGFTCSGDLVTDAVSVTCTNSNIVLVIGKDISSFSNFSGNIAVVFRSEKSNAVQEYMYVQNQFVGIKGSIYQIDTKPGGDAIPIDDATASAAVWYMDPLGKLGIRQRSGYLDSYASIRQVGILNRVMRGDYDSTSSQVNDNYVEVVHISAAYGLSIDNVHFQNVYPQLATRKGETEYFTSLLRWAEHTSRDDTMRKVPVPEGALTAHPELAAQLLKPGDYTVVENEDGSIDLAFNWGSYYNNPILTTPVSDIPAVGKYGITAEERAKYVWLAERGYANMVPLYYFELTPDSPRVSQTLPYTRSVYLVSDSTITHTQTGTGEGYYDASAFSSGSGVLAEAALMYVPNATGSELSGKAPVATSGVVGTSINVANKGSLARVGYTFTGWNTKADGKGTAYQPGDSVTLPREGITLYAQWKALADTVPVSPGFEDKPGQDPNKPAGYVTVTFAKGAHGTLSGTAVFHVNPSKAVTLKAPSVKPVTGWKFSKWDKAYTNTKFTANTTITALYAAVADSVPVSPGYEDKPGSDPNKPAGYVTVTFAKGAHGSLSGTSSFHVNPAKAVTLKAPAVKPVTGYRFSKWDKAYTNVKFTADTTITAQYVAVADSVGVTPGYEDKPGSDPNKPAGYVTVTFAKGAHGTLSGTSAFHVNPAKAVTLKAPTVKPATGWTFSKWDKAYTNTKFTKDTTVTALYVVVDQCAAVDVSKQERVYRLYNPVTSEHLFTTDANEYKVLAAKHGWKQERVAWVGPNSQGSSVGVYRLYNAKLGDHHYTKDKNEARTLVAKHGWVYDNGGKPLFYSEDNASCSRVPVYRQYNPGLKTGQHHYTADANERETLVKKHGWKDEQIGWYAVSWK